MLLVSGCDSLFLVTFQEFITNGSEGACDGDCFQLQAVMESVFDKVSCFSYN